MFLKLFETFFFESRVPGIDGGGVLKGKDLTGKHFGKLTVLEPTEQRVRDAVVWRCRCECGNEILAESRRLKPGAIFSCGCEPYPYEGVKDLTGYHFGKLLVKGRSGNKAKDIKFGRPRVEPPDNFSEIVNALKNKMTTTKEVMQQRGMAEATFYRRLREYRKRRSETI